MIKSNVTTLDLAGTAEAVKFSAAYSFYWLDNQSSEPVYASIGEPIAEADGTYTVPPGGRMRIAGGMSAGINLIGNGKVQIIGTNIAASPFKGGGYPGGGKSEMITPEKLGYAGGAVMFFDGVYNFIQRHFDNPLYWIDMASGNVMIRKYNAGSIQSDHYEKSSGSDAILLTNKTIGYDNFTVEVVFDVVSVKSGNENDIAANYQGAGFGVHIANGTLIGEIKKSSGYVDIIVEDWDINTKYCTQLVYDGSTFQMYINGTLIGTQNVPLNQYVKSSRQFSLGGVDNGSYSDGAFNYYRFAVYDRALTDSEISKNYNSDRKRFNM